MKVLQTSALPLGYVAEPTCYAVAARRLPRGDVIEALRMGFEEFNKGHRFVARQAANPIGDGRQLPFRDGGVRRDPAGDLPIRGVIDGTRRVGLLHGFVVKADVLPG